MSEQTPSETHIQETASVSPLQKLLICTTPRTASNTFMRMLNAANLGNPIEYFHNQTCVTLCAEWNIPGPKSRSFDIARYMDNLLLQKQHNAIFTTKIQFEHLFQFLLNDAGRGLFQGAKVVYLFRTNVAEQAASYIAASESGIWGTCEVAPISKARKSPLLLSEAIMQMTRHDMYWRKFFAYADIEPLIVTDQDIVLRPGATLAQIGQLLAIKPDLAAALAVAKNRAEYQPNRDAKAAILLEQRPNLQKSAFDRASYASRSANPLANLLGLLLRRTGRAQD